MSARPASPIRLAFVVHAMRVAGAEVLVRETIRAGGGRFDPSILCLDALGEIGERLRDDGVPVVCLGRRPGLDWRIPRRLAREVRRRRLEVLHAHQYTPFFYSALARLVGGGGCRLVFTEHGRHYPDLVSARRRRVNRLLLSRLAHAVTACSQFSRLALVERDGFPARAVEVIDNGVEPSLYARAGDRAALRRRLGLHPAGEYLAAVGRLHPVKDHATLLRGFARLARTRGSCRLLIVGEGELRPRLEALATRLDVARRVRFLGVVDNVAEILAAVDVFCQTSLSEAASLTILEAMASEIPVVVTQVGGNPEIVRHGIEGLLVPRGDAEALACAVAGLLDDPPRARRLGRAGRRRVERRFSLQANVASYLDLYCRLAGRPAPVAA